ncbi:MAG: class II fructose-bisphosphate aldolase [bacterium]|nr:class II fructose-bisphosphate aldolase [bacterium]
MVEVNEIMNKAWKLGILIPAFNTAYLPMVKTIVDTLKEEKTFGLVEVSRPDVEKFGAKSFADVAEEFYKYADLHYTRLHLDHVPVIDEDGNLVDWEKLIREGLELGYHSVMIDGSRLSLEENIACTKKVVEMAHPRGIPVEAELGAVFGHEKGPLPPYEELFSSKKGFTSVESAEVFVKETNVDWLSVAIGNIHGAISGVAKDQKKISAKLDIEHLKRLKEVTQRPLVLHGGSGIKIEYLKLAIENGITKINIGTEIRQAYESGLRESNNDISFACSKVADKIRELIAIYGIKGSVERLYS